MRNAFAQELEVLAKIDSRIILLSGDIGNQLFDSYKAKFLDRFFNCGVAEANLMSVAAGLAANGLRPIAYTITPFITTRCLEQIRVDVCYHKMPVVIVGVGAGLSYASLGATHQACEDVAFLRALPEMRVVCPGDPIEVKLALKAAIKENAPVYIRLGKKGEPVIHLAEPNFEIGKAIVLSKGLRVALLGTGTSLALSKKIIEQLRTKGLAPEWVSFHTVKPLDEVYLKSAFESFECVVTLEEHSLIGGFGSAVSEWVCRQKSTKARLLAFGTPDVYFHEAGETEYVMHHFGLTAEKISASILECLGSSL